MRMNRTAKTRRVRVSAAVMLAGGLILAATVLCGCQEASENRDSRQSAVEKHYKKGPAEVDLKVSRKAITIADKITLEIDARVSSGYTAELPEFDKSGDNFQIGRVNAPPPELEADGRARFRKTYVLKPFLAGTYTIPEMAVRVSETGDKTGESVIIETEPVDIEVKSLLSEDAEPAMKEIMPPEALPRHPYTVAGAVAAAILIAGLAFFGYRHFRRRRINDVETCIIYPPHEIAHQRLRRLIAEQLVEKGEYKLFYLRLSGILRRYIESRFGLRAPEQTTEEFLRAMKSAEELTNAQKQVLRRFLEHADLVKFARHQPTDVEIRDTLDTVRRFIDETAPAGEMETSKEASGHAL